MYVLLSRTQAGPGRTIKQEQEEISRNHVPLFIYLSVLNVQRQPALFQDANGIIPHLHGSTDPAGTFQRQMEAHGFQVVACEASYGEYDFGNDANSLVAELRAMGGPFSGSFIRYRVRALGCVN